ncbi:hypothetical protein N7527_003034 [Penicillium freii]|nr:hypothetical protein N7527_003034 [Penicillium freii]
MRILTEVVDRLAVQQPDGLWVKAGALDNGVLSWSDFTWSQLASAVDYISHWMEDRLGPPAENETMGYMGISDIRYPIMILSAMKMGYKILLASPRNSQDAQVSLLKSTLCKKFLHTPEFAPQIQALAMHHSELNPVEIPSLNEILLPESSSNPYYNSRRPRADDVALILHSSGSTGLPKPIFIRTGALAAVNTITSMSAPIGRRNMHDELFAPTLMVSMMPFFHIMGIVTLARSIYHQGPLALLPPGQPVTADLLISAIMQERPSVAAFAPSILEEMCNLPNGLEALSTLDYVFYGGAPLARSCGDQITRVTNLQVSIGSTEILNAPNYLTQEPDDWEYFEWSAEAGIVMEPATERSFEMVIKQKMDRRHQIVFHNFPELSEWRTKDLFEQHPTKPNLWRYVGRLDDLLVFSNGEKTNPVTFEKTIEGHPWVHGALVVGSGQFQAGLIIEPHADRKVADDEAFFDEIWSWVEKANAGCPAHAKVWHSMTMVATPEKPFKRSAKGSIMRKATYELYESEIAQLYKRQDEFSIHESDVIDGPTDLASIKSVLRTALRTCLASSSREYTDNDDIFVSGFDSLRVLQMSKILSKVFRVKVSSQAFCPPRLIYNNPTINQLSRAIQQRITHNDHNAIKVSPTSMSREEKMSAMIHKYTKLLPAAPVTDIPPPSGKYKAILTGSTGSLGTYLLYYMLQSPLFERIYCFNRSADAESRQRKSLRDRGLDMDNLAEKVDFLTTDLTEAQFGLSSSKYQELQENVNVFLHNSWPVNFNNSLESFESTAIIGVRQCIEFALSATHRPHIMFSSSIASVGNQHVVRDGGPIPEIFEDDVCLPLRQGYGESKHVASSILFRAARKSGLRATVLRLGQLGGPMDGTGAWNKAEWLPTLIATSKSLQKIPATLGGHDAVDWVPVDVAARSVIELTLSRLEDDLTKNQLFDCFNIVNPQIVQWNDLVHTVSGFYHKQGCAMEVVEYNDWLDALKQIDPVSENIDKYPGIKLTEFYEDMGQLENRKVHLATDRSVLKSCSLANLQPLDSQLVERWLERWAF